MKKKAKKKGEKTPKVIIGVNSYVEHSMSILDRIHELLEKKFEGKQIELAKALNKKESQVSKWLNGVQNFTLFTIAQFEEAFGEPIIAICTDNIDATFVQVFPSTCIVEKTLQIEPSGKLTEFKKLDIETTSVSTKYKTILI